jgi:hypothetical protein
MSVNLRWEISSDGRNWEQPVGVAVLKFTGVPLAIFGRRFPADRSGSGYRYELKGVANSGPWR